MRLVPVLVVLSACKGAAPTYAAFNWDADTVELQVTASAEPGDAVTADLHSTTNTAIIGDVRIEPGSGPVGTEHVITVTAFPEYEDRVDRAEILIESDARGALVIEMVQDSAELYRFVQSITSYGVDGEERTDRLTFRIYELVEEPAATGGGTDISLIDL